MKDKAKKTSIAIDLKRADAWAKKWDNLKPLKPSTLNILELFRRHFNSVKGLIVKGHGFKPVDEDLIAAGYQLEGDEAQRLSTLARLWSMVNNEKKDSQKEPKTRKNRQKDSSVAKEGRAATLARDSLGGDGGHVSDENGGGSSGLGNPAGSGTRGSEAEEGVLSSAAAGGIAMGGGLNDPGGVDSPTINIESSSQGKTAHTSREDRSNQRRKENAQSVREIPTSQDAFSVGKR